MMYLENEGEGLLEGDPPHEGMQLACWWDRDSPQLQVVFSRGMSAVFRSFPQFPQFSTLFLQFPQIHSFPTPGIGNSLHQDLQFSPRRYTSDAFQRAARRAKLVCEQHGEALKWFCPKCAQLVCAVCKVSWPLAAADS